MGLHSGHNLKSDGGSRYCQTCRGVYTIKCLRAVKQVLTGFRTKWVRVLFICVDLAKWVNLNKYRPWAGVGMHDIIMLKMILCFLSFQKWSDTISFSQCFNVCC